MEAKNRKLEQYVINQFNHFSRVTGYAVKVSFNDQDAWDTQVTIDIEGIDDCMMSRKRHLKRLQSLCSKLRTRYPDEFICVNNTYEKPLTPQQQAFRTATFHNRSSIEQSGMCGCYYCQTIFPAAEIGPEDYCDEGTTACCPHCGMDTVYGDASDVELTQEKLKKLHRHWFDS